MTFTIARKNGSGAIAWTEEQVRYIIEKYTEEDYTLKLLAEQFKVQSQSIRNLLRKNNINIKGQQKRGYPRNENYFEIIDNEEKAYWLGMMYSDGTISKNNNIALGLKDKEHVEKFQKAIGAINHKITEIEDTRWNKKSFTYQFSIMDKKIAEDLKKIGCVPNKTYEDFHFPNISKQYYKDFIRGYFDGDGSIYYSNSSKKYILSWVGNKTFLTELKNILGKEKISLDQNSVSKITYQLKICGKKDVYRILHWMYDSSTEQTRLNRKYEIVKNCLSSMATTSLNS